MKTLQLTRGKHAVVDDEDYAKVSQFRWYAFRTASGYWYAARSVYKHKPKRSQTVILMHRFLLGLEAKKGQLVQFKDKDGLNCRRKNLKVKIA